MLILFQVETLKQYEAEAVQLRGVNLEQQKALKVASKTSDQLQANEKTLTEEVQRLKTLLEREKKNLTTVQVRMFKLISYLGDLNGILM